MHRITRVDAFMTCSTSGITFHRWADGSHTYMNPSTDSLERLYRVVQAAMHKPTVRFHPMATGWVLEMYQTQI